jgi:GNAT superfamily N-acetyltransferase
MQGRMGGLMIGKADWEVHISSKDEVKEIDQKLGAFNQATLGFVGDPERPVSYVIKKSGQVIAGINACIDWGFVLYVDLLFVEEPYRHHGLGSFLLKKVEQEAKTFGAGLIRTDTYDFQAKDFYLKHGYEIFGVLDDCPRPGHKRFYLKKRLR